jgi:glycosyltransferase involved in cell wall biosynthesis
VGDHEGDAFYSCYKLLVDQVEQAGLRERVCFTGRVSDADLVAVLNRAEVLVLPSFSEGFGLPAVEAAACGTPAVVTTASPLPGLLGEGVIAIAPGDRAGWIRALAGVLGDKALRKRMGQAGLQAALRLSWNNSAQQLLAVFEEVVEVSATA